MCPDLKSEKQPPWGPIPPTAVQAQTFQVNFDPKYTIQIDEQNRPAWRRPCSCQQPAI